MEEFKIHTVRAVGKQAQNFGGHLQFHVRRNAVTAARVRFRHVIECVFQNKLARVDVVHFIIYDVRVTKQAGVHRANRRAGKVVLVAAFAVIFVITRNGTMFFAHVHGFVVFVYKVNVAAHRQYVIIIVIGRVRQGCPNACFNFIFFQNSGIRFVFRNFKRRVVQHRRSRPVTVEAKER